MNKTCAPGGGVGVKKLFTAGFIFLSLMLGFWGSHLVLAEDEVTFSMLPQLANSVIYHKWEPLLEYLGKKAGVKFQQVFPKNFDDHIAMCARGEVDFAYSNPVTYVQASYDAHEKKNGHFVLAIARTPKGTTDFYGLFITQADNTSIRSIEDIKGKTGWIAAWNSAGAGLFQQAYALEHGIDLQKDCRIVESPGNKQEKIIDAVQDREADFGCVRSGLLEMYKDTVDLTQIRVFARTPGYPAWVFSASKRTKPESVKKIKDALSEAPEDLLEQSALPGGVIGFAEASEKDLESVRRIVEKMGLEH
jgi:phosphonate transport system substrate-binding protein